MSAPLGFLPSSSQPGQVTQSVTDLGKLLQGEVGWEEAERYHSFALGDSSMERLIQLSFLSSSFLRAWC